MCETLSSIFEDSTVDIEQLESSGAEVSLESFGLFDKLSKIPDNFAKFFSDFREYVGEKLGATVVASNLIGVNTLQDHTKKVNYMSYSDTAVPCPPGFNTKAMGGLPSYVSQLKKNQVDIVERLIPDLLAPINHWLNEMIADPAKLSAIRDPISASKITIHDINRPRDAIAKFFTDRNALDHAAYGDLFPSHNAMMDTAGVSNALVGGLAAIDKQQILDLVASIAGNVELILSKNTDGIEAYAVNRSTMEKIRGLMLVVARNVEFFAAHAYKVRSLNQAMLDMEDQFKRYGKD